MHPTSPPPGFTAIAKALAERLPDPRVPEPDVADAFRSTLYAARERGILEPVADLIEQQGSGDPVVADLAARLRDG